MALTLSERLRARLANSETPSEEDEALTLATPQSNSLRDRIRSRLSNTQPTQAAPPSDAALRDEGFLESVGRGARSGYTQAKRGYGRLGQLAGVEGAKEYAESQEPEPTRSGLDFFSELGNLNFGEAADIAGEVIASQWPNYAQTLGGAYAGGKLGALAGPAGAAAGAIAGGYLGSTLLSTGEAVEQQQQLIDEGTIPELNIPEALLTGVAGGALEAAPILLPFTRAASLPAALVSTAPRRLGTGVATGAVSEAITEGAQEINLLGMRARLDNELEFLNEIFEPEQVRSIVDAMATGAIPGAAFGALSSPALARKAREVAPEVEGTDAQQTAQDVESETVEKTPAQFGTSQFTLSTDNPLRAMITKFRTQSRKQVGELLDPEDSKLSSPHLTLLYGLDLNAESAKGLAETTKEIGPIEVKLGNTRLFKNEDADYLVIDVLDESGKLNSLRGKFKETLATPGEKHAKYVPHITLHKFKKGEAPAEIADKSLEGLTGQKITFNALDIFDGNKQKVVLPLVQATETQAKVLTGIERFVRQFKVPKPSDVDEDIPADFGAGIGKPKVPPVAPPDTRSRAERDYVPTEPQPRPRKPTEAKPPAEPVKPLGTPTRVGKVAFDKFDEWAAQQDIITRETIEKQFSTDLGGTESARLRSINVLYNRTPAEKTSKYASVATSNLNKVSDEALNESLAFHQNQIDTIQETDPARASELSFLQDKLRALQTEQSRRAAEITDASQVRSDQTPSPEGSPPVVGSEGEGVSVSNIQQPEEGERPPVAPERKAAWEALKQKDAETYQAAKDWVSKLPEGTPVDFNQLATELNISPTKAVSMRMKLRRDGVIDNDNTTVGMAEFDSDEAETQFIIDELAAQDSGSVTPDTLREDYAIEESEAEQIISALRKRGVVDNEGIVIPKAKRKQAPAEADLEREFTVASQAPRNKDKTPSKIKIKKALKDAGLATDRVDRYVAQLKAQAKQPEPQPPAEPEVVEATVSDYIERTNQALDDLEGELKQTFSDAVRRDFVKQAQLASHAGIPLTEIYDTVRNRILRQLQAVREDTNKPLGKLLTINDRINANPELNATFDGADIKLQGTLLQAWVKHFEQNPNDVAEIADNFDKFSAKLSANNFKALGHFQSIMRKLQAKKEVREAQQEDEFDFDFSLAAESRLPHAAQINVENVLRRLPGFQVPVIFKQSFADLPLHVAKSHQLDTFVEAAYDRATGNIYVVMDNIANESRLEQVLLHEIFGHYGMESFLAAKDREVGREEGTTFRQLAQEVLTSMRSSEPITTLQTIRSPDYATVDAVRFQYEPILRNELGVTEQAEIDTYVAHEVIARVAEKGIRPPWYKRMIQYIRDALVRMGWKKAAKFDEITLDTLLSNITREIRDRQANPRLPDRLLQSREYMQTVGTPGNTTLSNTVLHLPQFSGTAGQIQTRFDTPSDWTAARDSLSQRDQKLHDKIIDKVSNPWRLPEAFDETNPFNDMRDFNRNNGVINTIRRIWGKSVGSMNFFGQMSGAFKQLLNLLNDQHSLAMRHISHADNSMRVWNEGFSVRKMRRPIDLQQVAGKVAMVRQAMGSTVDWESLGTRLFTELDFANASNKPVYENGKRFDIKLPSVIHDESVFDQLRESGRMGDLSTWQSRTEINMPGFSEAMQDKAKQNIAHYTKKLDKDSFQYYTSVMDTAAYMELETAKSYIAQYVQAEQRALARALANSAVSRDPSARQQILATLRDVTDRFGQSFTEHMREGVFGQHTEDQKESWDYYKQTRKDLFETMESGVAPITLQGMLSDEQIQQLEALGRQKLAKETLEKIQSAFNESMQYKARVRNAQMRAAKNIAEGFVSIRRFGRYMSDMRFRNVETGEIYQLKDLRSGFRQMFPLYRFETESDAKQAARDFNNEFGNTTALVRLKNTEDDSTPIEVQPWMDYKTTREATYSAYSNPMDMLVAIDAAGVHLDATQREKLIKKYSDYDSRIRHQLLQRHLQAGESTNYRRMFSANFTEAAHAIAARLYRYDVDDVLNNKANWKGDLSELRSIQFHLENATEEQRPYWERRLTEYRRLYNNPRLSGEIETAAHRLVEFSREHSNLDENNNWASTLRTWVASAQLGGSIASAAIQSTQTIYATFPYLATVNHSTGFGGGFGSVATMREIGKASRMAARLVNPFNQWNDNVHMAESIHKMFKDIDPKLGEYLIREFEGGRLAAAHYNAIVGNATGRWKSASLGAAVQHWMRFFTKVEVFNRMTAAIASYRLYYDAARQAGLSEEAARTEAERKTEDTIDNTQGNYTLLNRQPWARSGPGSVLMMYQMYPVVMMELLARMPMQGRALLLTSVLIAAGWDELPFAENAMDLVTVLGRWMGWSQGEVKTAIREGMDHYGKMFFEFDGLGTYGMHGLFDSVTGANIGQRIGFGDLIPGIEAMADGKGATGVVDELLGPAKGFIEQSGRFIQEAKEGAQFDNLFSHKVWRNIPISGVRNIIEGTNQAMTGQIKDSAGYKVADATSWDAIRRAMGLTSLEATKQYEMVGMFTSRTRFRNTMQQAFMDNLVYARINKDAKVEAEVWRELRDWNKNAHKWGMRIDLKPEDIRKAMQAARSTLGERYLRAASTQLKPLVAAEVY